MLDIKKRRSMFILATISVVISFLTLIPFGTNGFSHIENLIKFTIFPIAIVLLSIVILGKKFKDYLPTDRALSFSSYVPVFGYLIALSVYTTFLINRADPVVHFTHFQYVLNMIGYGIILIGIIMCLSLFDRLAIKFTKFSVLLIDIAIVIAFYISTLMIKSKVANVYETIQLTNHTKLHTIVLVVIGLIFVTCIVLRMRSLFNGNEEFTIQDKEELLQKWEDTRNREYYDAELKILYSLVNYSADRLSIDLYAQDNTKAVKNANARIDKLSEKVNNLKSQLKEIKEREAIEQSRNHKMSLAYAQLKNQVKVEVATTELEASKKELEIITANLEKSKSDYQADLALYEEEKLELESKMESLLKEKEEVLVQIKPVEEEKVVEQPVASSTNEEKKEKVFAFSYEELVKFAQSLDNPNLSVVVNPKGTMHRFLVGKKPYLITQKTSSDYRITFLGSDEKLIDYLRGYAGTISVANTPKGGNWLKCINKGEIEESFIKEIVSESLVVELANEKAAEEAKEAARLAKEAERAEEKANREKVRMAEKILAENEREAARLAKEAEREAIRQAKAAEKAKREAEKEAARLAKEAELEAAEEAARLAKEEELRAKEAELNARENELQATAEEEELKRKAELEAAEKAKREAEEHAERIKKEAEEAAEKAKREAEKEAARKAREAEKLVKEAEKEVAKKNKEVVNDSTSKSPVKRSTSKKVNENDDENVDKKAA